jgi:hypothetical protein
MKKKLTFLTEEEYDACKVVRKLVRRAKKKAAGLQAVRAACDADMKSDPGGARWQKASNELYALLDAMSREAGLGLGSGKYEDPVTVEW